MKGEAVITQDQKERFIELRAEGLSFDTISRQLDISKTTLIKLSRELSGDIERLKYINLEALAERHKMLKAERLEGLGRLLDKVDSALEGADFSKLSAEKLIELKLKLTEKMKAEISAPFTVETGCLTNLLLKDSSSDYHLKVD